jgi:dTDP-4-dehydrorhamnose 3,5-epimerase
MGELSIPGLLLSAASRIPVEAGDAITFIKEGERGYMGIAEVYGSFIKQGAKKGWRRHNEITLNIVVPVGQIRFVLYDNRIGSAGFGLFDEIILGANNYQRLTVPPGVWMAFEGLSEGENLLWNAINQLHDPAEADSKDLSAIEYAW